MGTAKQATMCPMDKDTRSCPMPHWLRWLWCNHSQHQQWTRLLEKFKLEICCAPAWRPWAAPRAWRSLRTRARLCARRERHPQYQQWTRLLEKVKLDRTSPLTFNECMEYVDRFIPCEVPLCYTPWISKRNGYWRFATRTYMAILALLSREDVYADLLWLIVGELCRKNWYRWKPKPV